MSNEIQWTIFAVDLGLSHEEISEIMDPKNLKPLHEAFIKEMYFRFPELRSKIQLGISIAQFVEVKKPQAPFPRASTSAI
jgi:hypothetical protein